MTDNAASGSPTPRTDAEENEIYGDSPRLGERMVRADFARSLERELAEAKLDNERMADGSFNRGLKAGNDLSIQQQEAIHYWQTRAESAERRAQEAERDANRYRWLRDIPNQGAKSADGSGVLVVTDEPSKTPRYVGPLTGKFLDDKIDAALTQGTKP